MSETIEVVFSFDTTGSMYPCLTQARKEIEKSCKRLAKDIPGIRLGIIAHGDYCDEGSTYVTKIEPLTDDLDKVVKFVNKVGATGGGDSPECYELVLHEAGEKLNWTPGSKRVVVVIGDDVPHGPKEHQNYLHLDWREELGKLIKKGINVYGVQALGRKHATKFYEEISQTTGGYHLNLNQFSEVTELILGVCYKQQGDEQLQQFADGVEKSGKLTRNLDSIFGKLLGKKGAAAAKFKTDAALHAVSSGRFQVMSVDEDTRIDEFVTDNGVTFKRGRGFYELTKSVLVQGTKEVILQHKVTGDLFNGDKAREMLGLPALANDIDMKIKPVALEEYRAFIQSTSNNRKLIGGTKFLYEVDDWKD